MERGLTTGEVAEQAGVNLQTVRYYERRGLLPAPPRASSGYRQYDSEYVRRIRFIKRAQELGFSLGEVAELLSLRADPEADRSDVRTKSVDKLAEIDRKIADLQRMKATLAHLVAACDGHGSTHDCPILNALEEVEVHAAH
ncbi:MAG TPA: MerR family DNA-binding protein [Rhodothermales bacterium]